MTGTQKDDTVINWAYPRPRHILDHLVGPGATKAELALQFGFALLGAISIFLYHHFAMLGWNPFQVAVAVWLAFDICGGIATNATGAAKRWWHRKGRGFKEQLLFGLAHFYMPLLVNLAFFPGDYSFFLVVYSYFALAVFVLLMSPLYLRRTVGFILYSVSLLLSFVVVLPHGMQWFIPFFFLKLLLSLLMREEPYRPLSEKKSGVIVIPKEDSY